MNIHNMLYSNNTSLYMERKSVSQAAQTGLWSPETDTGTADPAKPAAGKSDDTATDFLAFMKLTPQQRMEQAWLKQHGLTKEQFDALPPKQKEEIAEQMRRDLKNETKQKAENRTGIHLDMSA